MKEQKFVGWWLLEKIFSEGNRPTMLVHGLVLVIVFVGLGLPGVIGAQDFVSQQEEAEQELLRQMREAPPAPMPRSMTPPTEKAVPDEEARRLVGFDPETGRLEIIDPALDLDPGRRSGDIDARRSAGRSPILPGHIESDPFAPPSWMLPEEGMDGQEGDGTAGSCTPSFPVLNTHGVPGSTVHKLLLRFVSGGSSYFYVCSAASIGSFHLLTAGHCIYNHDPNQDGSTADAGFAAEIWAWAGQTDYINPHMVATGDEDRPFGFAKSVYVRTYQGWSLNGDLNYDMGYITLDRRDGDHTGWMGREAGVTTSSLNFMGYPSETPYVPSGEIRPYFGYDAGNVNYYTSFRINMCAFVYGGHSGGPNWRFLDGDRFIQGVNSTSDRMGTAEATLLTNARFDDITGILAEDEAVRPPLSRPDLAEYVFSTVDDKKDLVGNTVEEGGTFSVEYNVLNAGFADAGTVTVDFYLSTNAIISTGDTLVGTRTLTVNAWTYSNPVTSLTASIAPGTYYLGWIMRSSVAEYGGDQVCNGSPCTNVVVIADETLTVTEATGCSGDAYEPDNSSGQARTILPGSSQSHSICPETDVDWVTFTLDGSVAQRSLDLVTSGASGDTRMWLYDGGLNLVEFNDDDSSLFAEIHRDCATGALAPGTYYAAIDEFANNNLIDAYTLSLSVAPCTASEPDIHVTPLDLVFDLSTTSGGAAHGAPASGVGGVAATDEGMNGTAGLPRAGVKRLAEKWMDEALREGSLRLLVGIDTGEPFVPEGRLADGRAIERQQQAIRDGQDRLEALLDGTDGRLLRRFRYIPFGVVEVGPLALARLGGSAEVTHLEKDVPVPPLMSSSNPVIGSPAAWAAGYDGTGQVVAVLDTGVDSGHPFFDTGGNKVVSEACYSSNTSDSTSLCPGGVEASTASGSGTNCSTTISGCDHGTHVAGTVVGNNGSGPHYGVARGADLVAMQVFSRFDSVAICGSSTPCVLTYTSDQISGLERVYALRTTYDIAAVNMSLGGGQYFDQASCDAANVTRKAAIDNLRSAGIATVIASGNNGFTTSMGSPGCISTAISVGATTDADAVANFSNVASFLDLVAPGVNITSSVPGTGTGTKNGTSMATPHVAGAFAVLRQVDGSATVDEILSALRATATSVDDNRSGGSVNDLRRINVDLALGQLGGGGQTFVIRNDGNATLDISSMALTSSGPWIDWTPKAPFGIGAGGSVTVTVTVDSIQAPSGTSVRRLQILSNDPDESPYPGGVDIEVRKSSGWVFGDGFESGGMSAWSSSTQ